MSTDIATDELAERVRRELPSLTEEQVVDVTGVLGRLITFFQPERIYAFGSRARDDAQPDSDLDLVVIVSASDEPGYRRAQQAFRAVGPHLVPLDIVVATRGEFDSRRRARFSFAATILREGKELYAA